ncbi:hypothetical protein [Marinicellulosiphila megalodicopiae]|uniref:hypothetical protein n=1 Tax=Marinicellulosiphila megalodicopiae TaxID=2724896 RepID=UPI003BB18F78
MENYSAPISNSFDEVQQQQMNALLNNINSNEIVYHDEFMIDSEEGKAPPTPIFMFFHIYDAIPKWLKKLIDRQNQTQSYQIGTEEFRVGNEFKIGDMRISGFSNDRITIFGEGQYYKLSGYLGIRSTLNHAGCTNNNVHFGIRIGVLTPQARYLMFMLNPIIKYTLKKVILKVYKAKKAEEGKAES